MNTLFRFKWILGLIVLMAVVTIFSRPSTQNSTVTVGTILPLSGQYGVLGESIKKSMELSAQTLPAGKVTLLFEDDHYDAKSGLSAYHKLTNIDQADILITFGSPTVEITKPEIAKTDKIMFLLADELSHDKDRVFEIMPQGAGLFITLGQEASKRYKSVAVVYASDNNLFDNNHKLFLQGLSPEISVTELPILSTSDTRTEVSKIIQSKADAYTLFVPLETGLKLLKEIKKFTNRPQLICDANIELTISQYTEAVGPSLFKDCISVTMSDTRNREFVESYKQKYSTDPQFGSDYGYDAVQIIGKLAEIQKTSWLDYLTNSFKHDGVSGLISFDETGTRPTKAELHIFKDGKFVKLGE